MDDALLEERRCYVCGQTDDHPRDAVHLPDGSLGHHHIDCGARLSPPCTGCAALLQRAGDATGDALRTFLTTGKAA